MHDAYANIKTVQALMPEDWDTTKEGLLVDVREYTGVAQVVVMAVEDDSQASTEKVDVTVHSVSSDSDAPDDDNELVAMTQIVGQNTTAPTAIMRRDAVDIDGLSERYLQLKITETNTWEGFITAFIILDGHRAVPRNTSSNKDAGGGA